MTTAATDCPTCPACGLPCGVTEGPGAAALPAPRLACAACGHQWDASAADHARAATADAAHERKLKYAERTRWRCKGLRVWEEAAPRPRRPKPPQGTLPGVG